MPFNFPQGGDEMDRITEEAQINDDDFARRFGLFVKARGHGRHGGV